jgi:hypothetical protein
MSKRKYRLDVCPECKVKEGVSSRKRVYQCSYCERWFCKKHLKPRLVVFSSVQVTTIDSAWKNFVENERSRKDGHPDYPYTMEKMEEFKVKEEITRAKMDAFLDSGAFEKPVPKKLKNKLPYDTLKSKDALESETKARSVPPRKRRKGSSVGNAILVFGIIVLILGVVLIVFPQSFHEEGEFHFQSLGRPINAFDLGVIPENVKIEVDYDVREDILLSGGSLYVILINASELFEIDRAWNSRPIKDLLYPHYTEFRFDNVDFDYLAYDGPSEEGSLSWVTPCEANYLVLVWLDDIMMLDLVYFIRIDATWRPYFPYGSFLIVVGIVASGIGFAYRYYRSRQSQ